MENVKNKSNEKNLLIVSWFIGIGGGILMLLSLVLPFLSFSSDNYSMISYFQELQKVGKYFRDGETLATLITVLVILIGIFSFLALLFAFLKKPIGGIVFTVLSLIVFCLLCWDLTDRGVVSEKAAGWAVAYYIFIIGILLSLGGAVFMIVQKKKMNNQAVNTVDAEQK